MKVSHYITWTHITSSQLTMTSNMKNRVIKLSSTPVRFGMPSNLANKRRMMGRSINSTASNTEGRIPWMIPITTFGKLPNHASQWYLALSELIFETAPTNATT